MGFLLLSLHHPTSHTQHHTLNITHSTSHTQHHTLNITHSKSHTQDHTPNTHSALLCVSLTLRFAVYKGAQLLLLPRLSPVAALGPQLSCVCPGQCDLQSIRRLSCCSCLSKSSVQSVVALAPCDCVRARGHRL